ncbi:MAG: hypothetical protein K2W95_21055 [Candidatus Obscuribacterales bacterium]|nr:hypothetical protein [Candidatus Obscuribacterales bacterium]
MMKSNCLFLVAAVGMLAFAQVAMADEPSEGPFPSQLLPPALQKRLPAGAPGLRPRQSSINSSESSINIPSIITGDEGTFLHPKPQKDLIQSAPGLLPNRSSGGTPGYRPAGLNALPAAGRASGGFLPAGGGAAGVEQLLNSEGAAVLPDGSKLTRDPVTGATTRTTKEGYKFTQKPDGTSVFTRTNGLETERSKDGRIRMKQNGQYTGRELKF